MEGDVEDGCIEVGAVRPEEDHGSPGHGLPQPIQLGGDHVDVRVEAALEDHPLDPRHEVDEESTPPGGQLVEDLLGPRLGGLIGTDSPGELLQPAAEVRRVEDLLGEEAG